jgi:hypothetical protein
MYCGRPDPVSGTPHTALTAFRRRQELAQQGGGVAEPEDLRRSWIALWGPRRQRRQQAEAAAEEARSAALEADAQLTEALAARGAAEEAAVAARDAPSPAAATARTVNLTKDLSEVGGIRQDSTGRVFGVRYPFPTNASQLLLEYQQVLLVVT